MRRVVGACATLALGSLLLAGCAGGSPEPSGLDPEQSTPKPSRSSTPAKTAAPSEPVTFVRAYVDRINQSRTTGDVTPVLRLSESSCEGCRSVTDVIRKIHDGGGSYRGDPTWTIAKDGASLVQRKPAIVHAYIRSNSLQVVPTAGAKPVRWPGATSLNEFRLERQGATWQVKDFVVK